MLKIPRPDALRILHRLSELRRALDRGDTTAFDIKALRGHSARRRLRVGDYRAVYTVEDGELILWMLTAAHRRDVYRAM